MSDLRYALQAAIVPPLYVEIAMTIGLPLDGSLAICRTRIRDRKSDTQLGLNVIPMEGIDEVDSLIRSLSHHVALTVEAVRAEYSSPDPF